MLQGGFGRGGARGDGFPTRVGAKVERADVGEAVREKLENDLGEVLDELDEVTVGEAVVYSREGDARGLYMRGS